MPLFADEACQHLGELDVAAQRYQGINIKLDKTGGLTHALELARVARHRGLGLMAGSMCGSSLAIAPTFVLACLCDWVDIDGPLLQTCDRLSGLRYDGGSVEPFGPEVWGEAKTSARGLARRAQRARVPSLQTTPLIRFSRIKRS